MDYLPLFLDLRGKDCLVVGGGVIALRKIELLSRAGANVTVVAEQFSKDVSAQATSNRVRLVERAYQESDVARRSLVVAATDDAATNAQIFDDCRSADTLVNTVDAANLSNAIFPSIVDRDPVLVAISTGGRSPTLARVVRGWLETRLPPRLGALAEFAAARRAEVSKKIRSSKARQKFWDRAITGVMGERILRGDARGAEESFNQALSGTSQGLVSLVGAGPGDPELITLKGFRLLQQADVVLYDNLVSEQVLDYARRDAERIYVGKKRKFAGVRQESINDMLIAYAKNDKNVVRLKGGDPFIFGRGGEEIATLAAEGIDCVVVPGITAALGAASYVGIPLTHRDVAQSVRFVTGHRVDDQVNLDWPELINPTQTLVIYMGLLGLEQICAKLVAQGMAPDTPAVLIEKATLPEQREIYASIADLAQRVAASDVVGPTTIIVGEVVRHRPKA
ncbi:MAG: siroheme synthase CysG [Gammaproteobacteria bacterium]|nr:siroheme synthase CysG [Gammaproteobacteria bacterium]